MTYETLKWLWIFLASANLAAYTAFAIDKRRAETGGWRIPERTLLSLAFYGGSFGALLGRQVFRHKTGKQPFGTYLLAIAWFHIVLGVLALALSVPELRRLALSSIAVVVSGLN